MQRLLPGRSLTETSNLPAILFFPNKNPLLENVNFLPKLFSSLQTKPWGGSNVQTLADQQHNCTIYLFKLAAAPMPLNSWLSLPRMHFCCDSTAIHRQEFSKTVPVCGIPPSKALGATNILLSSQHCPAEPPLFQQQHRRDAEQPHPCPGLQLWCYTHHQTHLGLSEPCRSAPAAGTALPALAGRFGAVLPLSTGAIPLCQSSFGTQGTARLGVRPALCLHPPEIHHFSKKNPKAPDFPPQFVYGIPNLHAQRAQSLLSSLQESQKHAWKGSGSSNISH